MLKFNFFRLWHKNHQSDKLNKMGKTTYHSFNEIKHQKYSVLFQARRNTKKDFYFPKNKNQLYRKVILTHKDKSIINNSGSSVDRK